MRMTQPVREVVFPNEIPVDPRKDTRAIFVHVEHGLFAPHSMAESFRQVDATYTKNRAKRFELIANSVYAAGRADIPFDRSFIHTERDEGTKALHLNLSPLNDGIPESKVGVITGLVNKDYATRAEINEAKPNSWRPAARLDSDYEFGHAEGLGMPRYQIFAREAPAMTADQRRRVARGDMRPFGELALQGIAEAERIFRFHHGKESQFEDIHLFVAGMGAKALGAAIEIQENSEKRVASVTLMNFALGEQSLSKMARDYSGRRMVGEASELILPADYIRIPELTVMSELDKHGPELAMRIRQAKALQNIRMVKSIMNAKQGVAYIERLMANGTVVTIANGYNESLVAQTDYYLPIGDGALYRTNIVGVDGEKVGQLVNEHGGAHALVSNLGIRNYINSQDRRV